MAKNYQQKPIHGTGLIGKTSEINWITLNEFQQGLKRFATKIIKINFGTCKSNGVSTLYIKISLLKLRTT